MDDKTVARALAGRGGRWQQSEFEPAGDEKCPLVDALLFLFSWGTLSLPEVNWLAKCSIASGASHRELDILAGLGASGEYKGNMRRDLLRNICKESFLPRPLPVEVTALNTLSEEIEVTQPVLSLPEVLESLWGNRRTSFHELFGDNPRRFWEQIPVDDPKLAAMSEVTAVPDWRDITYPFIVHGDGGVYSKKTASSVLVVSAKSLLSEVFLVTLCLV